MANVIGMFYCVSLSVRASGVREDAIAMFCDSRQGVRKAGSEVPAPPFVHTTRCATVAPGAGPNPFGGFGGSPPCAPVAALLVVSVHTLLELRLSTRMVVSFGALKLCE